MNALETILRRRIVTGISNLNAVSLGWEDLIEPNTFQPIDFWETHADMFMRCYGLGTTEKIEAYKFDCGFDAHPQDRDLLRKVWLREIGKLKGDYGIRIA